MSETETAKKLDKDQPEQNPQTEKERQLANELQLISLIRDNPGFLKNHPELLTIIEVPHEVTGRTVSLIERQVDMLRNKSRQQDQRLRELMDVARDNERLAQTRHKLAINLLGAQDLDEVISIVLATLRDELGADYAEVKLFSSDQDRLAQADWFISDRDERLNVFKTMLQQKNTVCGNASEEQKALLFGEQAAAVKSAAIIPLVAGANLGLIGLGAADAQRFRSSMGTEFLSQTGELISAALAVHLQAVDQQS